MKKEVLLSICIPTYNRSKFLELCLDSIFSQVTSEMPIEVIVSDNASTDGTPDIALKYCSNPSFRFIRQHSNIGPMKNGLELVLKHSRGVFCWYLGDDDYVVPGALTSLMRLIQSNPNIHFYFLNIDTFISYSQFIELEIKDDIKYEKLPAFENILIPPYSEIFGAELMASIFRRDIFLRETDVYQRINDEYLSTLETSYTHSVVFANQFMNKNTIYVNDVIVLADNRAREWSDKSAYLVVEQLLSLIELYKSKGLTKYISTRIDYHFISISLGSFLKYLFNFKLKYRDKISFRRYLKFILKRPFILLEFLTFYSLKKLKKLN